MSGTPEPQSSPSDSAPLRISYHRDHTLIKLQSSIIGLQSTIIFFPPPKNYTFFERIRFPFKIGTGQVDNTAGICPLLLKQECLKINAQRILVDNFAEACPLHSNKGSGKIKDLRVLVDKWTSRSICTEQFFSQPDCRTLAEEADKETADPYGKDHFREPAWYCLKRCVAPNT